jgi:hypothetical protein
MLLPGKGMDQSPPFWGQRETAGCESNAFSSIDVIRANPTLAWEYSTEKSTLHSTSVPALITSQCEHCWVRRGFRATTLISDRIQMSGGIQSNLILPARRK